MLLGRFSILTAGLLTLENSLSIAGKDKNNLNRSPKERE
jgi:hypothetical protein